MDTGRIKDPGHLLSLYLPNVCPVLLSCTNSYIEVMFHLYTEKKFSTAKVHDFKGYSTDTPATGVVGGRPIWFIHFAFLKPAQMIWTASRTSSGVDWSDHTLLGMGSNEWEPSG